MSRLDYVTISIVVICLIALGFLVYKTIGLMTADPAKKKQQTEQLADDSGVADTYEEVDSLSTEDLDDDEVTGVLDDPESDISEDDLAEDAADLNDGGTTSDEDYSDDEYDDATTKSTEEEEPEPIPATPASYESGEYMVLAGSYRLESNAANQVNKLKGSGFNNARVAKFNKSTFAVALVDRFDSRSDADALVRQLKDKGFDAFVKRQK